MKISFKMTYINYENPMEGKKTLSQDLGRIMKATLVGFILFLFLIFLICDPLVQ